MKKIITIAILCFGLVACGKLGAGGITAQAFGNWAAVKLPDGCVAKQIAGEESTGVIVLCEDGRVFH